MASAEYSNCSSANAMGSSWHDLSKSDYAKVIFSDLYYNPHSSVGCRFQITDNVHEDPCDYVGLFKVGYDNLSECLVLKLLSQTECEEDGKLLRCTFKTSELPELESGYYQFLYVTRDQEVCGASLPFAIGHPVQVTKDCSSDEDVVADKTEDDFLVVRSNLAEKNRRLESVLDQMQQTYLSLEDKLMKSLKEEVEKRQKLEDEFNFVCVKREKLSENLKNIATVKGFMYESDEGVIQHLEEQIAFLELLLKESNDKIGSLEMTKVALEDEKNKAVCEKFRLQEIVDELKSTSELKNAETAEIKYMMEMKNESKMAEVYEDRDMLSSQLENAQMVIKALEESKQLVINEMKQLSESVFEFKEKIKKWKCENLALKLKLKDSEVDSEKYKKECLSLKSELTALKLHFVEIQNKMPQVVKSCVHKCHKTVKEKSYATATCCSAGYQRNQVEDTSVEKAAEEAKQKCKKLKGELEVLKSENANLQSALSEKVSTISELKNQTLKNTAVIEFLCDEKKVIQKNATDFENKYNECIMRLEEASSIYKKQYLEIQKLKKKIEKAKSSHKTADRKSRISSPVEKTQLDLNLSVVQMNEGISSENVSSAQNQSSDSDTGEHVLRHHIEKRGCCNKDGLKMEKVIESMNQSMDEIKSNCINDEDSTTVVNAEVKEHTFEVISKADEVEACEPILFNLENADSSCSSRTEDNGIFKDVFGQTLDVTYLAVASESSQSCTPKNRESPELQSMIEQNLARLSSSKSSDEEEVMYTIPCPVCDVDVGIKGTSSHEMVKHLEVQHKQQICPVCGRLFDMTLPNNYFFFHVEDHFMINGK